MNSWKVKNILPFEGEFTMGAPVEQARAVWSGRDVSIGPFFGISRTGLSGNHNMTSYVELQIVKGFIHT